MAGGSGLVLETAGSSEALTRSDNPHEARMKDVMDMIMSA